MLVSEQVSEQDEISLGKQADQRTQFAIERDNYLRAVNGMQLTDNVSAGTLIKIVVK